MDLMEVCDENQLARTQRTASRARPSRKQTVARGGGRAPGGADPARRFLLAGHALAKSEGASREAAMNATDAPKPGRGATGQSPADPATHARGGRPRRTVFPDREPPRTALRKLRHEVGTGLPVLEALQKQHPDDQLAQLAAFFRDFRIPAATGRKRPVAIRTRAKYIHIMYRVMASLRELNMRNRNLTELSARQVRAVHRQWEAAGASDSSLAMLNTGLRRFSIWMGKQPAMTPPLPELLADPGRGRRSTSATKPRTCPLTC
jgi:hypothetical protein